MIKTICNSSDGLGFAIGKEGCWFGASWLPGYTWITGSLVVFWSWKQGITVISLGEWNRSYTLWGLGPFSLAWFGPY